MSLLPWEPDRHLDAGIARSVIRDAFPDIDVQELAPLGSGWEFDAFVTKDVWVFRFPRRAEYQNLFDRERPALALARSVLPGHVSVPLVELIGAPSSQFPYSFAGHRLIEGVSADTVDPGVYGEMARSIGEALGSIHSVRPDQALAAGLSEVEPPDEGAREWFRRNLAGATRLAPTDPTVAEAIDWVSELDDPLRSFEAPPRFSHQDLSPEHLLVSPSDGRLIGILDWTDAAVGDAARDFVTCATFGGWKLVELVLRSYPLSLDAGFRERLAFMARLLSVMWLGDVVLNGADVDKHVTWVRNAFAAAS
jgi:aminoglycoside phosphotransferase (APT) family kinase protein